MAESVIGTEILKNLCGDPQRFFYSKLELILPKQGRSVSAGRDPVFGGVDLNKIVDADTAVQGIKDGAVVMVGGFGLVGGPLGLVDALIRKGVKDLTIISNNLGEPGRGLGRLLLSNQVRRAIGSYFTSNPDVIRYHREGRLEVTVLPQGTFAEAIRAGGAGIPAFFTPTAMGTALTVDKEVRRFGELDCVLEEGLRADVALVKANKADTLGNLTYYKTARNFNPVMATAADLVIAEVDELVDVGELSPEAIVTPHLYVDRLVLGG